ncbi:MAG TPA: response regulator [Thermoanaerobaculia bacterium]|jgi:PAS domain S-box-containing protein|nr:response regulator [Thermoanaerobaculia bacterium]
MATILIVDDRAVNRQFLAALLGFSGHRLLEAADGEEALEVARRERPDLIVTDIVMPVMDGLQLAERLRGDPLLASTPVIFYTATYRLREARHLAVGTGVFAVLSKPSEPQIILDTVNAALGLGEAPPPGLPISPRFDAGRERLTDLKGSMTEQFTDLKEFNEQLRGVLERGTVISREAPKVLELADRFLAAMNSLHSISLRLAGLLELSYELTLHHEPGRLLDVFCGAAQDILGARYAAVGILDDGGGLRYLVTRGMDAAAFGDPGAARPAGVVAEVLESRHPRRLQALGGDPAKIGLPASHPPIESLLAVPIASSQEVHGWLYLADRLHSQEFSAEDEQIACALAAQVAVAYENASLYDEIQRHAAGLQLEVGERRRADTALQRMSERLNLALGAARVGTWSWDIASDVMTWDEHLHQLYGLAPGSFRGDYAAFVVLIHADDRRRVGEEMSRALSGRESFDTEYRIVGPGRGGRVLAARGEVIHDESGQAERMTGVCWDLTERKDLEAQLRQSQKMEAIGRLAGGVAHDFNNLLTVIIGYSQLALDKLGEGTLVRPELTEVRRAGERAAGLTRQLLAFSRRQVLQPRVLDLSSVVLEIEGLLQRVIGEDVELVVELASALGEVCADPGQLEQVLMNLAVNARDAMPTGGRLVIATGHCEDLPEGVTPRPQPCPDGWVCLTVRDTGTGMDEETMSHIFEPFFTTKEPGKGTGLGLSTVLGIVEQSGGCVMVNSTVGTGTEFDIYLPRSEGRHRTTGAMAVVLPPPVPPASATIVVVEDEAGLRALVQTVLEQTGYRVLVAASPTEAEALFARHPGAIDLLLTDMVMPEASGRELARRVLGRCPGVKVLYMSGYSDLTHRPDGNLAGIDLLQKPFSPETLKLKVREALGSSS